MLSIAHPVRARRLLARAVIALALVWAVAGVAGAQAEGGRSVTVMTQNLYQGTEFRNIQGLIGKEPTLEQALAATTADYAT